MFERLGYGVSVFSCPFSALEFFRKSPSIFRFVFLDQNMQVIKGTQLASRFLEIRKDIPLVLMTGFGEKIPLETLKKTGIRFSLPKPFSPEDLLKILS